ncbi:MAG: hypothetical protein NTW67_03030 [Candidatus Woesearchaeota archaeon]|nr:hypothetical protein [Candidatus Woesearchaeota archaeon]
MKTTFFAFILIAIIGLGIMAFTAYDSSITGQGVKITIPKETLKKVTEKPSYGTQDYYSLNECSLFHEIYILRQELNLPTDRLENVKYICTYSDWW